MEPRFLEWSEYAVEAAPDPSGDWVSVRDPMWERLWIEIDEPQWGVYEDVGHPTVRADVLLSLASAFRAWGAL